MTDDPLVNVDTRRDIAIQFFLLFQNLSLEEMKSRVGGRLSKQTISRDREKVAKREAPSKASAEAYAAAIGRPSGYNTGDMQELIELMEDVTDKRRGFWNSQPIQVHETGVRIAQPKMFPRLEQRILEREWTAAIDIIQTFLESGDAEKHEDSFHYIEFYLGMAYRNLGDTKAARKHFGESFTIARRSDFDLNMKSHAAVHYALAIQESATKNGDKECILELLQIAIDNLPEDYPETLVNVLIVASRLSDEWFGLFAGRIYDIVKDPRINHDWASLCSKFMEQDGLQGYHENDMFKLIVETVDARRNT
ncbi:MAG: hypothetical protein BM559_06470 [Roseobacter sp. MedPE-SWchi]|nr:MAG: hypothetical protein BM559_06470 [Roseobacter sp. MedPE-SWchi]